MGRQCVVFGCSTEAKDNVKNYRIPADSFRGQIDPVKADRRQRWLAAIHRDVERMKDPRVCARHFITGRPVHDPEHPDYIPTQNVHTSLEDPSSLQEKLKKYEEIVQEQKRVYGDEELPRSICNICYLTVITFYNLKKKSMKVYNRWLGYVRLLQGNHPKDKFGEIQIRIYKSNSNDDDLEVEDEYINSNQETNYKQSSYSNQESHSNEESKNNEDQQNQEKKIDNSDDDDDDDEDRLVIDEDITKPDPLDITNKNQKDFNMFLNPAQIEENENYDQIEGIADENSFSSTDSKNKEFQCPVCQISCGSKYRFIHHFMQIHSKGKQKLPCPICSKICSVKYLKHHFRVHLGCTVFACPICEQQFLKKSGLNAHMKNQHKRLFSVRCVYCNEDFEAKDLYCMHASSQKHKIRVAQAQLHSQIVNDKPIVQAEVNKHNLVENSVIKQQNVVPMEVV